MSPQCTHLYQIQIEPPESVAGCEECMQTGSHWVHLRTCMTCGHVGCCDSSPNRHARKHAAAHEHAIVRSAEPGEDWMYCFVDDLMFRAA